MNDAESPFATLTAEAGLASGNECENAGAAFLLSGASALTLTNVLLTENVARQGGGVWLSSASSFTWSGGGWLAGYHRRAGERA